MQNIALDLIGVNKNFFFCDRQNYVNIAHIFKLCCFHNRLHLPNGKWRSAAWPK